MRTLSGPAQLGRDIYFREHEQPFDVVEPKEIMNFDELRRFRLADDGYIVITDSTREAIIHRVNSKCIKADSFNLKVTINDRKQGSYYWVDSIATAAHEFGAKRCKICKPELNLVHPSTFDT